MKNRGIKEKRFSFLKEHKLTAILFVICGLLLTLIPITASKYVTDKEVGTIDLTVTLSKPTLINGPDLQAMFPSNTTKIIFGKYSEYKSEVSGTTSKNIGYDEKTQNITDNIKLYNVSDSTSNTSTAYILSDEDIYANPDSSNMFKNLKSLTSIEFNNFDTSQVTNMGSMFYYCAFSSLDLSSFNTSKVTDMSYMFYCCKSLSNLDLSSFNTSKVTNMRNVFFQCVSLQKLDLSNFNTSEVTDMQYMFYNCKSLTNLNVSSFNTSKVTNMDHMFYYCAFSSIDLSGFNTPKVTYMQYMFYYCTALTTIYVSEYNAEDNTGWTTSAVTNSSLMFRNCTKLVGGKGTKLSLVDCTYARIDGGTSNPGYFTDIKDKPIESA